VVLPSPPATSDGRSEHGLSPHPASGRPPPNPGEEREQRVPFPPAILSISGRLSFERMLKFADPIMASAY
jgi:hypothetical protein